MCEYLETLQKFSDDNRDFVCESARNSSKFHEGKQAKINIRDFYYSYLTKREFFFKELSFTMFKVKKV